MRIRVVTLFPELVDAVGRCGVVGRGRDQGLIDLACVNPRDFTTDAHRTVDDRPYGGGPGMVMKYAPLVAAIDAAVTGIGTTGPVVCLSPQGRPFDQATAMRYAAMPGLVLVAGRYEGIDERVIEARVDEELSLGDFVLSGGEIAAMAVIDAVGRLLPGVLGDETSAANDSFTDGLLDCPHYTRPEVVDGRAVPEVLLSGDHERIASWRLQEALGRTRQRRPELLERRGLTSAEQELLNEWLRQQQAGDRK
ncbi:MAG: tRNA (guanosine(37)-N1)-methyltransferase TrmD [Woeseiaceae bacterium]|nr:tRNA (guanosine(37)-N1)-methyltransferase TrmD [Woeseiaceae bacterium]